MKTNLCSLTLLACLACLNSLFAQNPDPGKEKINQVVRDYFTLDRESIHLHLDKSVFLTNESIWFKGYCFDRKKSLPFFNTTNVMVVLLDEAGKKIYEKLCYANTGTFNGNFKLNDALPSGTYYLQVYTNWMNNFEEDESSVYKINIVNEQQPKLRNSNHLDYSKINIEFHPEGGNMVEGTTNIIGVKVTDCNANPISSELEIIDAKGTALKKVYLNKFGYGRFDLLPDHQTYKAVFYHNGVKTEATLPNPALRGIALEANNYAVANKTVLRLRTNTQSLASFSGQPLYVVIQQDEKASVLRADFQSQKTEQELIFPNDYLWEGVNNIRIIDAQMNQLAQRLVFKYPDSLASHEVKLESRSGGSLHFKGKTYQSSATLSITALPGKESLNSGMTDIFASLWLQPYLADHVSQAQYYFDGPSKSKKYELDLLLLNQSKEKYHWTDILTKTPKATYDFELGLTIKGTLNQSLTNRDKYKIRLDSYQYQIRDFSEIDAHNDFYFKNIILPDSSKVSLSLLKLPGFEPSQFKYAARVINSMPMFNKMFRPMPGCPASDSSYVDLDLPSFHANTVVLKEVALKQNDLKRKNNLNNLNLTGYKVSENDTREVLTYIETTGFNVQKSINSVMITGRGASSINGRASTPVIYVDDIKLMSYDDLLGMTMDELDEIYINAHTIIPSVTNNQGVIRMYRKKPVARYKSDAVTFLIPKGFAQTEPFKSPDYASVSGTGFQNFGILGWDPSVITDDKGNYDFQITDFRQDTITLIIEGFTIDGKLISEVKVFKAN